MELVTMGNGETRCGIVALNLPKIPSISLTLSVAWLDSHSPSAMRETL